MLKLQPNPTFWAKVGVHVPGQDKPVEVEFEFAHMTRDEYAAFSERTKGQEDAEVLGVILRGWKGVDAPFTAENLAKLLTQYHSAAYSIASTYGAELTRARLGN